MQDVNESEHIGRMISFFIYTFVIASLIVWIEHPGPFFTNSLILQKSPGEELEEWLKSFRWGGRSELKIPNKLPVYKFYTEVIDTLLFLGRKMGGNYQDALLYLREGLQLDRQFEIKLKELNLGTWLQMGMVCLLTWSFIIGSLFLVDVKVSWVNLVFIFSWQLCGFLILPFLLKYLRKKYFADIGLLWKMLYILSALSHVPLSRSEVFTLAGIKELSNIHQKTLLSLVEKLKDCCQKALQMGGSYDDEVKYIMGELRFLEKWHFDLFEKRLTVIKLGLLSLFFLPSYLAFIFLLLGDLLTLM